MSNKDKIDHILTYGQYTATSQEEANEIIEKAKDMNYDFTSDTISDGIVVYSLNVI